MSDQRRPTNYRKWDKRQFESFIWKFGSDPPSSPECTETLRPLGAPLADKGTEDRYGGVVPLHAFKIWWRWVRVGLGHHHGWRDFFNTSITRKPSSSLQSEPTCEIQEIEKHFQTDDRGLLEHQIWSCGLCRAPGEEDSQRQVVHQHLPAQGLQGLEHTPSKHWHLWPVAPPRQIADHDRRHSGLPGSGRKSHSAGHPPTYSLDLAPCAFLIFLLAPCGFFLFPLESEAAVQGEAFSGRRRCSTSSLLWERDFRHTSVNVLFIYWRLI